MSNSSSKFTHEHETFQEGLQVIDDYNQKVIDEYQVLVL